MSNQYFGDFISQGATFYYNTQKHNKKYTKIESLEMLDKIEEIITKNLEYLRQQRLEDGFMDGYMDYSIISMPLYSTFVNDFMKKNIKNSKIAFSQVFDNAIMEFLKKPERNVLWNLASLDRRDYYINQIIEIKNRIKKQINRMILNQLISNIKHDIIIVLNRFEKEYLYNLPSNVVGFVCRNYDNYDLILELSYAYEIPIISTSRNVSLSEEILIDCINKKLYIDPKQPIVEKISKLKSLYTFTLEDNPKYKSDIIKFYANIVDRRGIDKAKVSSWYGGVALFRTEFMYITKGYLPSKEEQIELYVYLLETFKDRLIQIRIPDFSEIKALDYEFEVFTEIDYIQDFHRIFHDNILAIHEASRIVNKQVTIIIPMLRMGKEIEYWKNQIEAYIGFDFPTEIKPNFGIMMETESAFLYYEDYRYVDSVIFGLNDFFEEAMDVSRYDKIDFEKFMAQVWHDLQGAHQYFRRNGIRLLHIVSGNALKQPMILRKFIKKGFKHFAIPISHIKVAEEVLYEHESTRGSYVGVYAKRQKAKLIE